MPSQQKMPNCYGSRVLLSDVMLYLFAKEAEKREQCKLPMRSIYKVMSKLESDFEDLDISITFEKTGTDLYSRRIDEAMYYLMPFDIQIVNPSFSILLEKEAANRRLRKLDQCLPDTVRKKLDVMFSKFDNALLEVSPVHS
ncbi:MAG TPA: hypothetical protein VED24_02715 [Candidatus Acidoferrum sp.]|nr:hypothetical protein [Candidatus Acidoferrum sp.]